LGQINAKDSIVQEIFVTENGQEIPSGDNFVVSSLHDAPVESWKEKSLRELEERYEKTKKSIQNRIDETSRRLSVAEQKAKARASVLFAFAENSKEEQLQTLVAFLSGEITHFFAQNSYSPKIFSIDDNEAYDTDFWHSRMSVEGMKLVSIFGKSDGRLDYRLHAYRDGSGDSAKIIPCTSYEDALSKAQEHLNGLAELYVDGNLQSLNIDGWLKIKGIKIPADAQKKFDGKKREQKLALIEKLRAEIADIEADPVMQKSEIHTNPKP
jgi:hypothetical protein